MPSVLIPVFGKPVTQGSTRIGRHGARHVILHDKHDELMAWRRKIATAAILAWGMRPALDEPVALRMLFVMPKPKRPRFEVPATKPDQDKLLRAVQDGLADARVYVEDSRVFRTLVDAVYEGEGRRQGVDIEVLWGDEARARLTV